MTFELLRRMPQTARLAESGIFFSNCIVASSLCKPARATFLTGQYPHNHGVVGNESPHAGLDQSTFLQSRLQAAGYKTAHIGKYLNGWQTSDGPAPGWNEWHHFEPQNYYNYSINDNGVITSVGSAPSDYYTNKITERVQAFIAAQTGVSQKFFLQIGHKAPHFDPALGVLQGVSHPAYAGCVPGSRQFPRGPNWNPASMAGKPSYVSSLPLIDGTTANAIDTAWRYETEELFSLDQSIAATVAALDAAGKLTDTVIVFTSDNGYLHGEFRIPYQKEYPYEPSIHVPLIVSGPASVIAQNKNCDRLVSHVDLAATFYELAGATSTRTLDGRSLSPLFADPNGAAWRSALLAEWRAFETQAPALPWVEKFYLLRDARYKLIEYDNGDKELYSLVNDPSELVNLNGDPNYAAIQAGMSATLAGLKTCSGSTCWI